MKKILISTSSLLLAILTVTFWLTITTVRDVTSLHFGAFDLQRLAEIIILISFFLLTTIGVIGSKFNYRTLNFCLATCLALSAEAIWNYPTSEQGSWNSLIFSPSLADLYLSILFLIAIFSISLPIRIKISSRISMRVKNKI